MKKIGLKVLSLLCVLAVYCAAGSQGMAQFASQATWGGTSTGTANAQVIAIGNVGSMSDLVGVTISFKPGLGLTNTGAATIAISSGGTTLSAVSLTKVGYGAAAALSGGELVAGALARATYDGTQWVLETNYAGTDPVGTIKMVGGATADPGYVLAYGQCISQTAYAALYAKYGTTYGTGCTTGQFPVPDLRGRVAVGKDNMGGTAANRVTTAGGNYDGTVLGNSGGQQSRAVAQANLNNFSLAVSDPGHSHGIYDPGHAHSINDPGHSHGYSIPNTSALTPTGNGGGINTWTTGQFVSATTNGSATGVYDSIAYTGIATYASGTGIGVTSNGSGTPLPTLSPSVIVNYEIKY